MKTVLEKIVDGTKNLDAGTQNGDAFVSNSAVVARDASLGRFDSPFHGYSSFCVNLSFL